MEWDNFLTSWAEEVQFILSLIPKERAGDSFVRELVATRQRQKPARESEIEATEERLESELPEDLRSFYLASNGWVQIGAGDVCILPVQEVDKIDSCQKDDLAYINEFVGTGPRSLIQESERDHGLLLTNLCQYGLYLANAIRPKKWTYSAIRLGEREDRFSDFEELMFAERERCLHDLRGYLG